MKSLIFLSTFLGSLTYSHFTEVLHANTAPPVDNIAIVTKRPTYTYPPQNSSFGIMVQTHCKNGICTTSKKELSRPEIINLNSQMNIRNEKMRKDIQEKIQNQQKFINDLLKTK
jgi:hypothetical protein